MIRIIPLVLLAVPLGVAAPVPPESAAEKAARLEAEALAKLWGKVESPPGKYIAKPDGNKLTLGTLGWPLSVRHGGGPAFRVVREVSSDFDIRLTVRHLDPPDPSVHYDGIWAETGAGLHIAGGDHSLSLYRWKAVMRDLRTPEQAVRSGVWIECAAGRQGGGGGQGMTNIEPHAALELRIVREKETVRAYTRVVGQDWQQRPVREGLKFPETVTVGVFLGHTTSMPCEATFADFTVEKPAKPGWFR